MVTFLSFNLYFNSFIAVNVKPVIIVNIIEPQILFNMKSSTIYEYCNSDAIIKFAKRNYQTYLAHYEARNLKPMPFEEFVKNYNS